MLVNVHHQGRRFKVGQFSSDGVQSLASVNSPHISSNLKSLNKQSDAMILICYVKSEFKSLVQSFSPYSKRRHMKFMIIDMRGKEHNRALWALFAFVGVKNMFKSDNGKNRLQVKSDCQKCNLSVH